MNPGLLGNGGPNRVANRPGMPGTVPKLTSGVPDGATSVPEFTDNQGALTYKAM